MSSSLIGCLIHMTLCCIKSFSSLGTNFVQTFLMPKLLVIIFQSLLFFIFSWQSNNDCHTPPALSTWHWPQSCLLKATQSWSHLSLPCAPIWTSCVTQKHVYVTWCYLHTLAKAFQVLVMEFSLTRLKIPGSFIACCS